MNKKVGILTFHNADNLGAVLQAFALQTTIEERYELNTEIIDYRCDTVESTKHISKPNSLKDLVKYVPLSVYYFIKRRGFRKFRNKYLHLSESFDKNNINSADTDYSTILTGSDQVWNPECSGNDFNYFLPFVTDSTKKVSYAASVGTHIFTDSEQEKICDFLADFEFISVRETSAAEQFENMGISNVYVLPDPVTLLSADKWMQYSSKRISDKKYVLVYLILPDVNVTKAAEKYAKEHNCVIINNKKSFEFIMHNSPSDFLSWVMNAECVFTNSFHGTAFSLIFNKPLGVDIYLHDGRLNNRVFDFLKKTDCLNCAISENQLLPSLPNAFESINLEKQNAFSYLDSVFN